MVAQVAPINVVFIFCIAHTLCSLIVFGTQIVPCNDLHIQFTVPIIMNLLFHLTMLGIQLFSPLKINIAYARNHNFSDCKKVQSQYKFNIY